MLKTRGAFFFKKTFRSSRYITCICLQGNFKKKLISEIYLDIVNHDVYCNTFQESAFQGNIVNVLFSFTKKKERKKAQD